MPAGPEPTTATSLPVRRGGICGSTQLSPQAWSMMFFSMFLIVTGSLLMLRTQASSQGAGQMRPVNSGKLFVEWSRSIASRQRPRYTRSFQSGMMFPSGQPLWQKGMPQSMQRAPWRLRTSSGVRSSNSRQCRSRSGTGCLWTFSRSNSRKPVILPMLRAHASCPCFVPSDRREARRLRVEVLLGEHRAVLDRHDPDEMRDRVLPAREEPPRDRRVRVVVVALDQRADGREVPLVEGVELDHALVAALLERAVVVEHVGDAAAHAGGEIAARAAEDHDQPPGHVLAAVVADAFDHRGDAAVAHAEPFAGLAAEEDLAARRAVERDVAHDDVLLRREGRVVRRVDDDAPTREALAEVVVRVALELDGDALGEPRAEALARGARELDADRLGWQPLGAVAAGDLRRQHRSGPPVTVRDRQVERDRLPAEQRRLAAIDQRVVE